LFLENCAGGVHDQLWQKLPVERNAKSRQSSCGLPDNREYLKDPQNQPANGFLVLSVNPEPGRSAET